MLGRSMGGGVTLNALVAKPGLVDAAVIYASRQLALPRQPRPLHGAQPAGGRAALYDRFGTPQQEPAFYRELSSRTYFDRITEPVLIHHGANDETCPFPWARTTQRLLGEAGVDSRLVGVPRRGRTPSCRAGRSRSSGPSRSCAGRLDV